MDVLSILIGRHILMLALLQAASTTTNNPKCKIRCGILSEQRGRTNLYRFVSQVWSTLRLQRGLKHVELQLEEIEPRTERTMSELLQAYINIGSSNASVVIGTYMQPIATATERHGVPYFVISDVKEGQYKPYNLITIFPNLLDIYYIAVDLVDRYQWRTVGVFYESLEGLFLLERLVQNPNLHVRAWKINSTTGEDAIRHFLLEIRQLTVRNIIVLSSRTVTDFILKEALRLSMMSEAYSWIIPCLNYGEKYLMDYSYTQVNLTTFHLVQNEAYASDADVAYFTDFEYATVYDSLLTLYDAIVLHHRNTGDCLWVGKDYLLPTLARVKDNGATGTLAFKSDGTRQGYHVDIMALFETGLYKIGFWNSSITDTRRRLQLSSIQPRGRQFSNHPLSKEVIRVVTLLEEPFVRLKADHTNRSGNDRFEGFCIDILDLIAKKLDFKYTIYLVSDGQYGERQPDGTWTGLVNQLMNGNASLALGALSITSSREQVIDFTKPFKADGISLVMRRPTRKSSFFQFTEPLSGMVWLLMLGVFIFMGFTLYLLDKVAPPSDARARFSIVESFWFTFASMMLCSTEIHPRTIAARLLAGGLWVFSLIIISTYTANLAAFLTVSKFDSSIGSIFDLLEQTKVRYGTVKNSDVGAFFQNNKLLKFQQLWQMMSSVQPDSMVATSSEGFLRAKDPDEDYAFIWDTPAVRYRVENDCDYVEIGGTIGSRGYGIGLPLGAQYREDISLAILQLSETGTILMLEQKWWTSPVKCPDLEQAKPNKTTSLSVDKVGGVFIILGIGVGTAIISALLDYLIRVRHSEDRTKNRRVVEKSTDKVLYDGTITPGLQLEEPFLDYGNKHEVKCSGKQTNIF